jgi:hypothetical protein
LWRGAASWSTASIAGRRIRKENATQIEAIDLGDLLPIEILKESIRRNASHGRQLETSDKRKMAGELYDQGMRDQTADPRRQREWHGEAVVWKHYTAAAAKMIAEHLATSSASS